MGDEEPSGAPSPPPGAGALPDLAQGQYLVGGAPPGFLAPATMPPPELRSFRGCISDIQVSLSHCYIRISNLKMYAYFECVILL